METEHKPKPPIFDLSALTAVHSLFEPQEGISDPWGVDLAGSFTNLLVFSDSVRAILPNSADLSTVESIVQPSLIHNFANLDSDFIIAEPYSTIDHLTMTSDSMAEAAIHFDTFARQNKERLRSFCALHHTAYVQHDQRRRIRQGTTFDVARYQSDPMFVALAQYTNIDIEALIYAFDLSLRMPLYGNLAGHKAHYLNHPVRDAFNISVKTESVDEAPPIPISLAEPMRHIVNRLSKDEYITTIKILRDKVRELGIIGMPAGQISQESVRELAASARFRPRLRAEANVWDIVKVVMTSALGIASTPYVGVAGGSVITGVAITVLKRAWDRDGEGPLLPQGVGDIKWLRWAVRWDVENQEKKG